MSYLPTTWRPYLVTIIAAYVLVRVDSVNAAAAVAGVTLAMMDALDRC